MNSMIIMAIKDSTYTWHWDQSWITEVDSYGSRTLQNNKERSFKYDETVDVVGCPFTISQFHLDYEISYFEI